MHLTGGRSQFCSSLLCAIALLLAAAPAGSAQQTSSPGLEIKSVDVGLAGHYKVGYWTPVAVTLSTDKQLRGRLVLTTLDDEGLTTRFVDDAPVELKVGETRLERCVRFGNLRPALAVEFVADDTVVTRKELRGDAIPPAHASTSEIVAVIGGDLGAAAALPNRTYRHKREVHVVELKSLADLPQVEFGLDAVDLVTLATSDITSAPANVRSLTDWVLLGGRCIIACGKQGELLFGDDGALRPLAPGEFDRVGALRRTAALEAYAGSIQRIEGARSLDLLQFKSVRGRIDAAEGSGSAQALVMHYPAGFGLVSLIAVDLDQPPLDSWPGRSKLMSRVLALHQPGETGKGQGDRQVSPPAQLGYHDLAGQLRMALDQFEGVRLIAFSWVAALIAGYIVLVGPLDYFLVRFGLRRMQATWGTLSLLVIAFVALAWWLDARLKSQEVQLNQAEIVDLDAETGLVRGNGWMHLYGPRTATYDLTPESTAVSLASAEGTVAPRSAVSWQGLPGEGLGGLDGRATATLFDSPYEIDTGSVPAIRGVPVQTSSTRGFAHRWSNNSPALPEARFQLTNDGLLVGRFEYPLTVELENVAIYYDRFLYPIAGVVKPGRTIELSPTSSVRDMRFHLTQKRVIDSKEIVTPWNARSADVPRILEVMMLHKAAGGDHYTGLTARYDARIDLSDHLATGRALLVGTGRQPLTHWRGERAPDAPSRSAGLVRIVIPVSPAE